MQDTNPRRSNTNQDLDLSENKPPSTFRRVGIYALVRIVTIGITIFFGVFLAVVVANKGGGIDTSVADTLETQVTRELAGQNARWWGIDEETDRLIQQKFEELAEASGLNDPFLKKHLRWTWNALRLDLGDAIYTRARATYVLQQDRDSIKSIILTRLPNTLVLVGLADLMVFLVGIPLSLYLSRNYGNFFDRIINVLSPLSSVPSWVHGILLILVFAVTLRILPPGGMYDIPFPDTQYELFISRLKHMILPSFAIFLSLLFQLVYTWRNYFMIYSNEDYVDFAVAQGLSHKVIQNKYILRPALPYVLTSFALTLVSFWQMATALEIVFNWDGIGSMYIISMPHFWGESMFPGEMGLTIGIVVIFAYLLGLVVFLLDISYAIVDPRIRLGGNQQRVRATRVRRRWNPLKWFQELAASTRRKKPDRVSTLKHNRSLRLVLVVVLMLVIGIGLGATFGWLVWPVEYTDAAPADLAPAFQVEYVQLLIDSFNLNQDSGLAHQRLNSLGENTTQALNQFIETAKDDSDAQEALASFAQGFDPNADSSEPTETASSSSKSVSGRVFALFLMIVGGAALFWASISLYLKLVNRPARKPRGSQTNSQLIDQENDQISSLVTPQPRTDRLRKIFREMVRYPSAVIGMIILSIMIAGSLYAVIRYPYQEIGARWYQDAMYNSRYVPRTAAPKWINWFRKHDIPETISVNSQTMPETKTVKYLDNGNPDYTFTFTFDYPYQDFPSEGIIYFETNYKKSKPFATFIWTTPDGREFELDNAGIEQTERYNLEDNIDRRDLASHKVQYKFSDNDVYGVPVLNGLFAEPESESLIAIPGTYTLEIKILCFEPDTNVDVELVLMGKIFGIAGTDFMRRDLTVPMLWGMPFALGIGMFGALLTTIVSMLFAAFGVWFGGWADNLVQRVTEANMILPVVAIAVLFYAFYGTSLWVILGVIVILNAFGSPTKTFRAAFIQVKEAGYIEAAQAYGASNRRIIFRYMIPRILPVIVPQLVTLIPGFIFLEATLGMFNVKSTLPTWGKVIYEALSQGAAWGSKFWVLEPIALLLLTGFAFSMMGFALDRVLNPRLQQGD